MKAKTHNRKSKNSKSRERRGEIEIISPFCVLAFSGFRLSLIRVFLFASSQAGGWPGGHYKAASKCRLYHTSSNINKRNSYINIKKDTTKYAALFQGRGVVCPLSADVTLKYTTNSNINGLNKKQILYNVSIHLQRFVFLLSFSFKPFPLCTSM